MKTTKDEKKILNIIKFSPIILVILISFFISNIYLIEMKEEFHKEVELTKQKYLFENQERVKNEIQNIYNLISYEKEKSEQMLKQQIKDKVYEAHAIASNIYKNKKHLHTKEELFSIIKDVLVSINYNNCRGYFFIMDAKGKNLLQKFNKELENKRLLELKNKNGYKFVEKITRTIDDKSENFDSYYWQKPDDKKNTYKKISFYKYLEPYNVVIGTGEYINDFKINLQEELLLKIRKTRGEDSSYIFIFDDKGTVLSHHKDSLIGTNRLNIKNPLGKYVVKDILEFAKKNKKGFMTYSTGVNPENLKNRDKISYIQFVEDWNWTIGTGFFLEKFDKEIEEKTKDLLESEKKSINKIIKFSLFITLVFIVLSFYLSNKISNMFLRYRDRIEEESKKTIEKERLLTQQSKMATMGEMIGNIAHQWKQPLSVINASCGNLKINKELDTLTDKEFFYSIDTITNSVHNLSDTIDDFRNFFNPNKKSSYFYLEDTFDKTLKLMSSQFKSNDIEIIKEIEHIELYGLENELLQTLINILKNAKDELVKIEGNENHLIFIKAYEENQKVIIKIKDNAGGVANDIIDKIFDPYFTTKADKEGTGIGLYMSKQIIENMQGSIEVQNLEFDYEGVLYQGAEFTLSLIAKR